MIKAETKPVVLLFGPSGAGKSTLATWLVGDLNMTHINFDDWDHLGIDGQPIKRDFETFMKTYKGRLLRSDVMAIMSREHTKGAVLTFPSDIVPTIANLNEAQEESMTPIILFGPKEDCYQAFLSQNQSSIDPLPPDNWPRHNAAAFKAYVGKDYLPFEEIVFPRRTMENLIKAVEDRIEALV